MVSVHQERSGWEFSERRKRKTIGEQSGVCKSKTQRHLNVNIFFFSLGKVVNFRLHVQIITYA